MKILRTAILHIVLLTCTEVVLYSLLFLINKQEETKSPVLVAWTARLLFLPRQSNPCSDVPRLWNIPCRYMKNFLTSVRSWAGAFQKCWAHNQSSGFPPGTTGMWKQTRISSWLCIHIKVSKESQKNHNKLFHHLWLADSCMFLQLLVPLNFQWTFLSSVPPLYPAVFISVYIYWPLSSTASV